MTGRSESTRGSRRGGQSGNSCGRECFRVASAPVGERVAIRDPDADKKGPTMIRLVMAAVAFALALIAGDVAWAQPTFSQSQDPMAGARVFAAKGCEKCHAINGVGGKIGPDLAKSTKAHSFFDVAAALWNHLPRMTDRMKQLGITRPELTSQEAGDLIGFLYTLNYFDPPGNAASGQKLFTDKKCAVCHQVGGSGGTVGPKLDNLKQFASPMFLASAMWNH